MDEAAGVALGQRVADLRGKLDRPPHVHRPAGHLVAQRRPGGKLVGEVAVAVLLDDVEERRDVGMIERLRGARLLEEFLATRRRRK